VKNELVVDPATTCTALGVSVNTPQACSSTLPHGSHSQDNPE